MHSKKRRYNLAQHKTDNTYIRAYGVDIGHCDDDFIQNHITIKVSGKAPYGKGRTWAIKKVHKDLADGTPLGEYLIGCVAQELYIDLNSFLLTRRYNKSLQLIFKLKKSPCT